MTPEELLNNLVEIAAECGRSEAYAVRELTGMEYFPSDEEKLALKNKIKEILNV